jgi:hypothetical protein
VGLDLLTAGRLRRRKSAPKKSTLRGHESSARGSERLDFRSRGEHLGALQLWQRARYRSQVELFPGAGRRQRLRQQTITYNGLARTDEGFFDYFKPRVYTDVNFNYRYTNLVGFFLNARNLTNVAQDAQRYGPVSPSWSRTYRREEFGVQYTIGVKGSF